MQMPQMMEHNQSHETFSKYHTDAGTIKKGNHLRIRIGFHYLYFGIDIDLSLYWRRLRES
jgi:hypothetical protein